MTFGFQRIKITKSWVEEYGTLLGAHDKLLRKPAS
jgi:hypothetical protein